MNRNHDRAYMQGFDACDCTNFGNYKGEPFCGHGRHPMCSWGEPDFDGEPPFPPMGRPPFPPHGFGHHGPMPHVPAGPDPHHRPEFPPFGAMEDYDSLPIDGKLLHRLRGMSHKLRFLSGSIGGQRRVLTIIKECPGITQRQLMDLVRVRPSSLSEVLGKLEAAGQIRRQVCPYDRRTVQVYPTDAGNALSEEMKAEEDALLFDCLSADEKAALLALLEKIDDAWAKRCPPPPRKPTADTTVDI